jgi:anti-sigma B factor antagonist
MNFSFLQNKLNDIVVFSLQGNLMEKYQANELINNLDNELANNNKKFILNLEKLEYLNSSGIGVLINLYTKVRNHSGELILSDISEQVKKLILISKLNSVFTIKENTDEAKNYFQTLQLN